MMDIPEVIQRMENKGPQLSEAEVSEFETEIGAKLPEAYRKFLMACNGGILGKLGAESMFWVDRNYGFYDVYGLREQGDSLRRYREIYQSQTPARIPLDLLPIANGIFGNVICLAVRGERYGHVYWWDHEMEPDPKTWDGTIETSGELFVHLADSFPEFVAQLKKHSDDKD